MQGGQGELALARVLGCVVAAESTVTPLVGLHIRASKCQEMRACCIMLRLRGIGHTLAGWAVRTRCMVCEL
eukprot:685581-Pleurochrysis_carterae.AAC.3